MSQELINAIERLCFRFDVVIDQNERAARAAGLPQLANQKFAQFAAQPQQTVQQSPVQQFVQPVVPFDPMTQPTMHQQYQPPAQIPTQQMVTQAANGGQVTDAMILELVTPIAQDERGRPMLQAEMQAMGIATLPDAKPEQYAELYQRFLRVQQQLAQQNQQTVPQQAMQQQPYQGQQPMQQPQGIV